MRRQVAIGRGARVGLGLCLALVFGVGGGARVWAADPAPPRTHDRPHPDADKINQANPAVRHAGPGTPLTGTVFVPPSLSKGKGK